MRALSLEGLCVTGAMQKEGELETCHLVWTRAGAGRECLVFPSLPPHTLAPCLLLVLHGV